jgi:hypothetical protein
MISQITNGIINEMVTLIYHNGKWTAKLGENVMYKNFVVNSSCIGV